MRTSNTSDIFKTYFKLAFSNTVAVMKTEKQKISQSLLLLKILQEDGNILGNLKLQKQVFLNELRLLQSNIGGLYYKYFRYNYGPFSGDLWMDFTLLANKGFVYKTTHELTPRGRYLLEFVEGSIRKHKDNEEIFNLIERTTAKYRKYTGTQLMNLVYELVVEPEDMPRQKVKIEDIPAHTNILLPECHTFKYELKIPDHFLDDIKSELGMDKDTWDNLEENHAQAIKRATQELKNAIAADPP